MRDQNLVGGTDAPRPAPLVSPAPMPAVSDTLRRIAFDLVIVGTQRLLEEQPSRTALVQEASVLLRTVLQRLPAVTPTPTPPPENPVADIEEPTF